MSETKQKQKRMVPLIRVRQVQLDQESMVLAQIRQVKKQKMAELLENQRLYLEGVERLNKERMGTNHGHMLTLESSVDFVRNRWHVTLLQLREIEARENAQLANVMVAQRNLRALEKLKDRYGVMVNDEERLIEQKILDETAARLFSQSRG